MVKVKALEWVSMDRPFYSEARIFGGLARYLSNNSSGAWLLWVPGRDPGYHDPLVFVECVAFVRAAQSHYDDLILSTLEEE